VNRNGNDFYALACNQLPDLHFTGDSQCLPLYRYENGKRVSNLTAWGVQQFRAHYADNTITAADIFAYTYAALHCPAWREKYAVNLRQEFPRLPFYADFRRWARWGDALLELHLNFAAAATRPATPATPNCAPTNRAAKSSSTRKPNSPAFRLRRGPTNSARAAHWNGSSTNTKKRNPATPPSAQSSTPTASPPTKNASSIC